MSHYSLLKNLRKQNVLPSFNSILEIGEQNWYGDLSPKILLKDIKEFAEDSEKDDLENQLKYILEDPTSVENLFAISKIF